MKKLTMLAGITILGLSLFVGCGSRGPGKTEEITDATTIAAMDAFVSEKVYEYFGYEVDSSIEREYQALESYLPVEEGSKEYVHQANIFQAISKADPEVGVLHGYGGILDPTNQELKGLIINVYNERGEGKSYTDGQLTEIATRFLKETGLMPADADLSFAGYNGGANSDTLKVILIEGNSQKFAVGIETITGAVVYFERADSATGQ